MFVYIHILYLLDEVWIATCVIACNLLHGWFPYLWRYELNSLAQEFDELQQEKSQLEDQLKSYRRHVTDELSLGSKIPTIKKCEGHIILT